MVTSNGLVAGSVAPTFHQLRSTQQVDSRQSYAMSDASERDIAVTPSPNSDEVRLSRWGSSPCASR